MTSNAKLCTKFAQHDNFSLFFKMKSSTKLFHLVLCEASKTREQQVIARDPHERDDASRIIIVTISGELRSFQWPQEHQSLSKLKFDNWN